MENREVVLVACALFGIASILFLFEKRRFSAKELATISALAGIAAFGRVSFAAIPSVQCTTFIVIVSGAVFGRSAGFAIGASSAVLSNVFLGQGPWTFFQMLAWGICGVSAALFSTGFPKAGRKAYAILGFVWGYLFGWFMNLFYWLGFVYPLSFASWVAVNGASFVFDTAHAATNFLLCWFFSEEAIRILKRFKGRLSFEKPQYLKTSRVESAPEEFGFY